MLKNKTTCHSYSYCIEYGSDFTLTLPSLIDAMQTHRPTQTRTHTHTHKHAHKSQHILGSVYTRASRIADPQGAIQNTPVYVCKCTCTYTPSSWHRSAPFVDVHHVISKTFLCPPQDCNPVAVVWMDLAYFCIYDMGVCLYVCVCLCVCGQGGRGGAGRKI